jgi:hypothetical protein
MNKSCPFEQRVFGPNEIYARWDFSKGVDFDRREKSLQKGALKYINAKNYQLSKKAYSREFLEFLPAEPFIPMIAKIVGAKNNFTFTSDHYSNIRRHLLETRMMNYKWINFIKYDGQAFKSTPYFLNAFGKFYYETAFNISADTMAKGFYRNRIISNRDCSVRHLFHLYRFYVKSGHDVVMGKYPFDMIVDNEHGFVLTEMHENSIGIEMRLSEAIFQGLKKEMNLYLPSMTVEHRGRNCGIMGGLLFQYGLQEYSFASCLEPEICSDTKIKNWSYFITKTIEDGVGGNIFADPLPFPKINIDSSKIVATQLTEIGDHHGTNASKRVAFQHSMRFVNGLIDREIIPGIKVTAGFGQIRELWTEIAEDSDILITGKIRMTILDNLKKLPKVMIISEFNTNEVTEEERNEGVEEILKGEDIEALKKTELGVYRTLKRKNVEIMMLPRNHAKAILNKYKLMIHSMPTTHYMGNNRESYGIIDFSGHPDRDEIHAILYDMLIAFGKDNPRGFTAGLKQIKEYFHEIIGLYGHFSSKRTVDWVYYKKLIYCGKNRDYYILTSHIDFKDLTRCAKKIYIQGVSRFANHKSLMYAKCPVIKERMWHPRMVYNKDIVGLGSWDFAQIKDQKELQMIIHTSGNQCYDLK